jgi:transcriptional regulator with XRE-family HTH domain
MSNGGDQLSAQVRGARLKAARERKRLNQTELGKLVGIHRATVSSQERGRTVPLSTMGKLREVLDLDENLLPLDSPTQTRAKELSLPDLIAEYNATESRRAELGSEIIRRLVAAEGAATQNGTVRPAVPRHAHESPAARFYTSLPDEAATESYSERPSKPS